MNIDNQICRFSKSGSHEEQVGYLEKNSENSYVLKVDRFIWDLPVTSEYDFIHTTINGTEYTFNIFKKPFNIQLSHYYNNIKCEYHINQIFEGTYDSYKDLCVNNMSLHFNNLLSWFDLDNKKYKYNSTDVSYINFLSNKNNTDDFINRIRSFNNDFANITIARRGVNLSLYIKYHTFKKTNSSLPYFLEQEPMISLKYNHRIKYDEFTKDVESLNMLMYLLFNNVELYRISSKLNDYPTINDNSLNEIILPDMPDKQNEDNLKPLFHLRELRDVEGFFNTWFSFYHKFYTMLSLYTSLSDLDKHPELQFINYIKSLEYYVSNTNDSMNISFKLENDIDIKSDNKWIKRNKNRESYNIRDLFKENIVTRELVPTTRGIFIILFENFKIVIIRKLVNKLFDNYNFSKNDNPTYTDKILFVSNLLRNTRNFYIHPTLDNYHFIVNENDLDYCATLLKCLVEACILYELKFRKSEINNFLSRRYEKELY